MIRRGQIFLILTILSISFLVAITGVLLEIRRAEYLDPVPESDRLYYAWENSIDSIELMFDLIISENSQLNVATDITGLYNGRLNGYLTNLKNYLEERAISTQINLIGNVEYYNQSSSPQNHNVTMFAELFLSLSTPNFKLEQTLLLRVSYFVNFVGINT
ncbi:MAG: hypothetical protein OEZ01_04395, partial [Candidatus Heimdallarchaeota archaeon]|nr:hypothetical protein [Candidatus Heimdallarchaeota archaeon]